MIVLDKPKLKEASLNEKLSQHPAARELHRIILRLDLVSHVSAAAPGKTTPAADEDIGGKRPPGGIDHKGDREDSYRQKSAVYFRRRWRHTNTVEGLEALLDEARDAAWAWAHTPDAPTVVEPERNTFLWKCAIADDTRDLEKIKAVYRVSRATVYRYRATYKGLRSGSVTSTR